MERQQNERVNPLTLICDIRGNWVICPIHCLTKTEIKVNKCLVYLEWTRKCYGWKDGRNDRWDDAWTGEQMD